MATTIVPPTTARGLPARSRRPYGPPQSEVGALSALRRLAADIFQQSNQRRRRDARDPGRLTQGGWLVGLQLLPDFIGKPADRAVIEIRRHQKVLTPPIRGDILPLAGQIAAVA